MSRKAEPGTQQQLHVSDLRCLNKPLLRNDLPLLVRGSLCPHEYDGVSEYEPPNILATCCIGGPLEIRLAG